MTTSATVGSSSTTSTRGGSVVNVTCRSCPTAHATTPQTRHCSQNREHFRGRQSDAAVYNRAVPDVVIPVLNEAAALPGLLAAIPAGFTPIVVDNGSEDGSGAIARAHGARVVDEPVRGFGAACNAGLLAADSADGILCFMDGAGPLDPVDLVAVTAPVLTREADLVVGARRPTDRTAWPLHARMANYVLAAEI